MSWMTTCRDYLYLHYTTLFRSRSRHGARLTALGEVLVRHAEAIEAQLDRAGTEISLARDGIAGPLRIAIGSEGHTSELQSRENLVCRLLLENKNDVC